MMEFARGINREVCVGVDNGSGNFQIVTPDVEFIMENKIDENREIDRDLVKSTKSFNVVYDNTKYVVGKHAEQPTGQVEGKDTQRHLISLLVGLSQAVPNNSIVHMATGESVNKYFDLKHKQSLINKMQGEHQIEVNGQSYTYIIQNVHVLPEGIGHKLLNPKKYINRPSYTIDLGASTANYLYCEGVLPVESDCKSFNLGMHNLVSSTQTALNKSGFGLNIPQGQIKYFIENGSNDSEIQAVVNSEIDRMLDRISSNLATKIDLNAAFIDEVEFVGGTSKQLQEHIKKKYKKAVFIEEGMWTNVRGCYKFAKQKFGR